MTANGMKTVWMDARLSCMELFKRDEKRSERWIEGSLISGGYYIVHNLWDFPVCGLREIKFGRLCDSCEGIHSMNDVHMDENDS